MEGRIRAGILLNRASCLTFTNGLFVSFFHLNAHPVGVGALGRWSVGALERWSVGTLKRWDVGALGRWGVGTRERGNVGTWECGSVQAIVR
jgi:hypothetical protein